MAELRASWASAYIFWYLVKILSFFTDTMRVDIYLFTLVKPKMIAEMGVLYMNEHSFTLVFRKLPKHTHTQLHTHTLTLTGTSSYFSRPSYLFKESWFILTSYVFCPYDKASGHGSPRVPVFVVLYKACALIIPLPDHVEPLFLHKHVKTVSLFSSCLQYTL